jgi:hypothetical protein
LSDKVSLSRKQIDFIVKMTEIEDQENAVERFMKIMIDERVDPSEISYVVDRIMKKMEKR